MARKKTLKTDKPTDSPKSDDPKNTPPPPAHVESGLNKPNLVLTPEQHELIAKDLQLLSGRVCEFLRCFMVLGYTMEGIPIQIVVAKTQQDVDSLNHSLQRFLMNSNTAPSEPPSEADDEPDDEPSEPDTP